MAIADDFSVALNGDIRYTGAAHGAAGAGYYTVIELHRFLQDKADDENPATANDLLDITSETPSDRSTDNIITLINSYNIDDTAAEHLFDGSIIQAGGDTIYDGLVVIANEGMDLQILQSGVPVVNDFWNNLINPADINAGIGQTVGEKGINRDPSQGLSHRFMLKVRDAGADIDGRRIIGTTRELGFTYSEFRVNGTARGNNVLALTFATDLNNQTAEGTLAGLSNITFTEGYITRDYDANTINEFYYVEWDRDTQSMNELYERSKWVTRRGSVTSIFGLTGDTFRGITHEVTYNTLTGTFDEGNPVTFGNGATAQVLADDGVDTVWVQVLTGVIPSSGSITQSTPDAASATVTASTEYAIPANVIGVSTGTAIIGARGVGIANPTNAETLFDLGNNQILPPNNVQFTVNGLVVGEDRVLVGPDAGGLQLDQFSLQGAATSGATSITVDAGTETPGTGTNSATDTPTSGTIRVQEQTTGIYQLVTYTGFSVGAGTMTFTGLSGMPDADDNANVFITYIDKLATAAGEFVTVTYSGTNRPLFVRVRDGGTAGDTQGIRTFETTGAFQNADSSVTAIRTSDV